MVFRSGSAYPVCRSFEPLETGQPVEWEVIIYDRPFADIDGSPMILEMGIDVTERQRAAAAARAAPA